MIFIHTPRLLFSYGRFDLGQVRYLAFNDSRYLKRVSDAWDLFLPSPTYALGLSGNI